MAGRRYVFNLPQASVFDTESDDVLYVQTNAPALMLEEHEAGGRERHSAQLAALGKRQLSDQGALFGQDLGWAFRDYIVHRLWVDDEYERYGARAGGRAALGSGPPRPVATRPQRNLKLVQTLTGGATPPPDEHLYLFNVLVALEWVPDPEWLRRLEWAFRRASDYLYDVTNGVMAFGQVVFGDVSWMHCADIQVFASNRILPRSWVGGLLIAEKYTPIRVGRGLWVRDRRVSVSWDEPEGYRSLVHEWAHYALGLKDGYLERITVAGANGASGPASAGAERLVLDGAGKRYRLVIPKSRLASESIMATPEGNSEFTLEALQNSSPHVRLDTLYPELHKRMSNLPPPSGPGGLPLPLPLFQRVGALAERKTGDEGVLALPFVRAEPAAAGPTPVVPLDSDGIPVAHWEVYLVRPSLSDPQAIIAQGEIDAHAPLNGFQLYGVEPGDTVLVIGRYGGRTYSWAARFPGSQPWLLKEQRALLARTRTAARVLGAASGDAVAPLTPDDLLSAQLALFAEQGWSQAGVGVLGSAETEQAAALEAPDVDVLPLLDRPATEGWVKIQSAGPQPLVVLSLDNTVREVAAPGQEIRLPSLDGYVVAGGGPLRSIAAFSQGGGPVFAPNVGTNPIAAGSSNGEALVFFHDDAQSDYSRFRLVTTMLTGHAIAGIEAASPVFSLAANDALPEELSPTLLILNTVGEGAAQGAGELFIFRVTDGAPVPLPTYLAPSGSFAAAPLTGGADGTGGSLLAGGGPHVERFVLGRLRGATHS